MLMIKMSELPKHRRVKVRVETYTPAQIRKALRNARASVAIEGFHFTSRDTRFLLEKSLAKTSQTEFVELAKELARNV